MRAEVSKSMDQALLAGTARPRANTLGIREVVSEGFCIGCGACTADTAAGIKISQTAGGRYVAQLSRPTAAEDTTELNGVCPFASEARDEDAISRALGFDGLMRDDRLGWWRQAYAGHVRADRYREAGSSGGFVTWLLCTLLEKQLVDAVVHVGPTSSNGATGPVFAFKVSRTGEEIKAGSKTRYYPVEMSAVLATVMNEPGRYAFAGVPCFIKSLRLLAESNREFDQRLEFTIALLCGHQKSAGYQEYIAWQMGVEPSDLETVDFRYKQPGGQASDYAVRIERRSGKPRTRPMKELRGGNWGLGLFKYKACDYCDDVMGETADVTVGDAWIRPYSDDPLGSNVIVVRDARVADVIEAGRSDGSLALDPVPPDVVAATQAATFRHRREGLAYRLWLDRKAGRSTLTKRVQPGIDVSWRYARIFRVRAALVAASEVACATARACGDWSEYWPTVEPLVRRHNTMYILNAIAARLKRLAAVSGSRRRH